MKTATAAKIAAQFNDYLEASRKEPVLVTRNGKPVAVLVAVHDKAEAEHVAASQLRSLKSVFEEAHKQIQKGQAISHGQFWREVEQSRRAKQPTQGNGKKP